MSLSANTALSLDQPRMEAAWRRASRQTWAHRPGVSSDGGAGLGGGVLPAGEGVCPLYVGGQRE